MKQLVDSILTLTVIISFFTLGIAIAGEKAQTDPATCTHQQICHLLGHITGKKVDKQIPSRGDHHHHDLTTKEIRPLIRAKMLILPPKELQPWGERLIRERPQKTTFMPLIAPQFLQIYKESDLSMLAHFWAYPETFCHVYDQIVTFLREQKQTILRPKCPRSLFSRWQNISLEKYAFIITHNGLEALLKKAGAQVFTLKNSYHDGAITAHTLKNLSAFIKKHEQQKLIWVFEEKIKIQGLIKKWVRPQHTKINLDIMSSPFDQKENVLSKLLTAILAIR